MADRYSSLYDRYDVSTTASGAVTGSTTFVPKGARPVYRGESVIITGQYDLANGTLDATDQLFLTELPQGARILSIKIWPSADFDSDNDFTFNLGTVASATAFATASAALQAVTGFSTTVAGQAPDGVVSIGANERLVLARAAGELNATGTLFFAVELTVPGVN